MVGLQRKDDKRRKVLRAANTDVLRAKLVHAQASVASDYVLDLALCCVSYIIATSSEVYVLKC